MTEKDIFDQITLEQIEKQIVLKRGHDFVSGFPSHKDNCNSIVEISIFNCEVDLSRLNTKNRIFFEKCTLLNKVHRLRVNELYIDTCRVRSSQFIGASIKALHIYRDYQEHMNLAEYVSLTTIIDDLQMRFQYQQKTLGENQKHILSRKLTVCKQETGCCKQIGKSLSNSSRMFKIIQLKMNQKLQSSTKRIVKNTIKILFQVLNKKEKQIAKFKVYQKVFSSSKIN
ncbi:Hypothetical_protein [Hexamita inflata]|uniref:Hypothetical_protein n=1 Tax=Hexamita inflata TaxID=28002 RepID=A0AA86RJV8_9EUKA|nr:Hypothetical protein HINF_LOCUS65637 [Hexamita inflata]